MTTAGEAASLFGSPDPALDPFAAALGGDDTREEPHSNAVASDAVADLFGSATDPFPVDGGETIGAPATEAQQAWYDPAGQQSYAYGAPAANAYTPTYPEQPTYQQNGAYAAYAQPQYAPAPAATTSGEIPVAGMLHSLLMLLIQRTSRLTLLNKVMRLKHTRLTVRRHPLTHRKPRYTRHQPRRRTHTSPLRTTRISRRRLNRATNFQRNPQPPQLGLRTTHTSRHTLWHPRRMSPARSTPRMLLTARVRTLHHM